MTTQTPNQQIDTLEIELDGNTEKSANDKVQLRLLLALIRECNRCQKFDRSALLMKLYNVFYQEQDWLVQRTSEVITLLLKDKEVK